MKNQVEFRKITKNNYEEIINLSYTLTPSQRKSVADNSFSIAEGSVHENAYYRGVYLNEKPIGFFMLFIPNGTETEEEDKDFFLWRLMIARDYQYKGYGRQILDRVCIIGLGLGFKELLTSCETHAEGPLQFYKKYGFIENGKTYGEEVGLTYLLKQKNE